MMNHTDKETNLNLNVEDISNTSDKNKELIYKSSADQFEHWERTLSFPSYVIDTYKNKYPTTYAELRLDGLNKQQIARYIYRNCELCNDKMFDMNDNDVYRRGSGFGFVRYLSSN